MSAMSLHGFIAVIFLFLYCRGKEASSSTTSSVFLLHVFYHNLAVVKVGYLEALVHP